MKGKIFLIGGFRGGFLGSGVFNICYEEWVRFRFVNCTYIGMEVRIYL